MITELTAQDVAIWWQVTKRWATLHGQLDTIRAFTLFQHAIDGDAKDAKLMHDAEEHRGQWMTPAEAWCCEWGCPRVKCGIEGCTFRAAFPVDPMCRIEFYDSN